MRNWHKIFKTTILALILCSCALAATDLQININFAQYLEPEANAPEPRQIVAIFAAREGFSERQLCNLWRYIQNDAARQRAVEGIFSPFEIRKTTLSGRHLAYDRLLGRDCFLGNDQNRPSQELAHLRNTPWESILTNPQLRDLLFEFRLQEKAEPEGRLHLLTGLKQLAAANNLQVYLGGDAFLAHSLAEGLRHDQGLNLALAMLLLLLGYFFYRSWQVAALLVATLGASALLLAVIIVLLDLQLNLLTNGIFLICAIAAIQDFIFILQKKQRHPAATMHDLIKSVFTPCLATTLTSMIGFGSLYLTDLKIVQEFGLLAALGSAIEFVVLFSFVPLFLTKISPPKVNGFGQRLAHVLAGKRLSTATLVAATILMVISPLAFLFTLPEEDPLASFDARHPIRVTTDYLQENRDWLTPAQVVFNSQVSGEQRLELSKAIAELKDLKVYDSAESYLTHFTRATDPTTAQLITDEVSHSFYFEKYHDQSGRWFLPIYLKTAGAQALHNLKKKIAVMCGPHCEVQGLPFAYADFSQKIIPALIKSFAGSLLLIIIFMAAFSQLILRRIQWSAIFFSLWGAVIASSAFFVVFGLPINYLTCIIAAVLLGVTGDNAIHFIYESKWNDSLLDGIQNKAEASIIVGFMTAIGALVLVGSYFTYPKYLGVILACGFTMSLLGDIWLLDCWLRCKGKRIATKQALHHTPSTSELI